MQLTHECSTVSLSNQAPCEVFLFSFFFLGYSGIVHPPSADEGTERTFMVKSFGCLVKFVSENIAGLCLIWAQPDAQNQNTDFVQYVLLFVQQAYQSSLTPCWFAGYES